ncbi:MAG: tetratricopeptide repeat protein [Syntrophorhabdaceae bacterium]
MKRELIVGQREDYRLWTVKGDELRADEDWSGLIEHCRMWLKEHPDETGAQILLGEGYKNTGQYEDAMDLYLKVATKRLDDYTAWYWLASVAVKAGKTQEAIEYFSMAIYTNSEIAAAIKLEYPELYEKIKNKTGSNRALRLCVGIIILILFAFTVWIFV